MAGGEQGMEISLFRGTSGRIYRTGELDQQAIAGGLYDAPSMRGDGWIEKGLSDCLELGEGAFFIHAH